MPRFSATIAATVAILFLTAYLSPPRADTPPGPGWARVANVALDDALNLRAEPNPRSSVLARIAPTTSGLRLTGEETTWRGARWLEIVYAGERGWVNARFLIPSEPPTHERGERRMALVIGVSAYDGLAPALPNPTRDAALMRDTLVALGFDVTALIDPDSADIRAALAAFAVDAAGAEIALFYFAGHGLNVEGESTLLPRIDARTDVATALEALVPLSAVVDALGEAGAASTIIILDACRDLGGFAQAAARGFETKGLTRRVSGSGLGRVVSERDFMIVYATDPNNVALDGSGDNSPFTQALAMRMLEPEIDLGAMMVAVRRDVVRATGGAQSPWVEESLTERVFLTPPPEARVEDFFGRYETEHRDLLISLGSVRIVEGQGVLTREIIPSGCDARFTAGLMTRDELLSTALNHQMGVVGVDGATPEVIRARTAALAGRSVPYLRVACGDRDRFAFWVWDLGREVLVSDKTSDGGGELFLFQRIAAE